MREKNVTKKLDIFQGMNYLFRLMQTLTTITATIVPTLAAFLADEKTRIEAWVAAGAGRFACVPVQSEPTSRR